MRPRIGDQQRLHALHDAGALQRPHAARGQRQVDGAAALGLALARVGAALVQRHAQAAPRQQQRQQRAGEPGADDVDAGAPARRSRRCRQHVAQRLREPPRVLEAVVERHRRHADDVRARASRTTTPRAPSASNTLRPRAAPAVMRIESWQPRSALGAG